MNRSNSHSSAGLANPYGARERLGQHAYPAVNARSHLIYALAERGDFDSAMREGDEALQLGMADALITKLSNIKQIVVRPTSSILRYSNTTQDPVVAGREQMVDSLLEGKVQRSGDRIRVTVQLIRVSDGKPLWADTFDETFTNIFAVQDSISKQVAQRLVAQLTGEEQQQLAKRYTDNTEAYQLYLKGRFFWNKFSEDGLNKAIDYFKQACAIDRATRAYAGLADSYVVQGAMWHSAAGADMDRRPDGTAEKAVALDDTLQKDTAPGRV